MRLRARDHYTSSTLVGGEGGAGPSSLLHTTLEGPTEYVNARWMWSLHRFLHGIEWIVFHGHLDYFQKPPLGGSLTQSKESMALRTFTTIDLFYLYHVWGPAWIETHWVSVWLRARSHMTYSHYMILEVCGDGLWTLSCGLSQFHGHGSWLECEVALSSISNLIR